MTTKSDKPNQPAPRYDDVHADGVAWLDELATEEATDRGTERLVEIDPTKAERMREPDAGPVTAEEAMEIAQRFIDGHFRNAGKEGPRISIPADPMRDDDIRLVAFIEQSAAEIERLKRHVGRLDAVIAERDAAIAERDELRRRLESMPPWPEEGEPLDDEQMRALMLRWSTGPELYQADADALIASLRMARAELDDTRAERDQLRQRLRLTEETLIAEVGGRGPAAAAVDRIRVAETERDWLRREIETLRDTMREDAAKIERLFATPEDQRAYDVKARVTEILRYARRLDAILEAAAPTKATSEGANGGES